MRLSRTLLATLAAACLAAAGLVASTGTAQAAPSWAPADSALIHPGTMMYTDGAQCTANFVYTDGSGNVYVGYAAHCAGKGESTDTNGCNVDSVPIGTKVDFSNDGNLASEGTVVGHGTLAYSSWITEHQLGTSDANICAYNDLALVKVDAADAGKVNPSVPFWGGPTGIDTDGTAGRGRGGHHRHPRPRGGGGPAAAARRRRAAEAAHRRQLRRRRGRRRLVAPGVHGHPRHPRRLRQRLHERRRHS